jgi:hypothetical protein
VYLSGKIKLVTNSIIYHFSLKQLQSLNGWELLCYHCCLSPLIGLTPWIKDEDSFDVNTKA